MIDQSLTTADEASPDIQPLAAAGGDLLDPPALRAFTLRAFDIGEDGEEDLELIVQLPEKVDIRRHASMALLWGLAVMSLDQDGTIEKRMEALCDAAGGYINEADACNKINLLLMKDANDQRI